MRSRDAFLLAITVELGDGAEVTDRKLNGAIAGAAYRTGTPIARENLDEIKKEVVKFLRAKK